MKYKEVISSLGVQFAPQKTFDSLYFFEFLKRLFWKGHEVSPFPISALKNEGKFYYLLTNLLISMEGKGYQFVSGVSSGVHSYYGMVRSLPSRFRRDIREKSFICELIIKIINGSLPAAQLNLAMQALGYTFQPSLTPFECKNILENIVVEEFSNSHPSTKVNSNRKCVGLGQLAIDIVTAITGLPDDKCARGLPLIYHLPILNSYSRIEVFYTKLSNKAITMKE